jgi:hypothetical protein
MPSQRRTEMTLESFRDVFMWCTLINYGILLLWFLIFTFAHDWMQALHGRWFTLHREQFDAIHYAGIAGYKILILIFNLVPWIALSIVYG